MKYNLAGNATKHPSSILHDVSRAWIVVLRDRGQTPTASTCTITLSEVQRDAALDLHFRRKCAFSIHMTCAVSRNLADKTNKNFTKNEDYKTNTFLFLHRTGNPSTIQNENTKLPA